jgi:acetyl-CoA carboxylase biotin carboxyl carrier protein
VSINFSELRELLSAIAQTGITELNLKTDDFELSVRKSEPTVMAETLTVSHPSVLTPPPAVTPPLISPPPSPSPEAPLPSPLDQKWTAVTSPMVGTFYRAPAPAESPFVELGDNVRKGQAVCIIEAMKLMNEIETEIAGQIMEIAVANGEPVEYGQPLMWIKAS